MVTGAATGIGAAIAGRLAADGHAVMVADIDAAGARARAEALRVGGHAAEAVVVDISDSEGVDELAIETDAWATTLGQPVRVLVNNAGITGPHGGFADYDQAALRRVIDIDLVGTMLCTQALLPLLLAAVTPTSDEAHAGNPTATIVNLASIAGRQGNPRLAPYSAAKAGVIGFTKSLGKELAATGLRVHAVAPGGVGGTDIARAGGPRATATATAVTAATPMGRLATPDEIAALVVWLCSPECSYTTGAVHDISGGRA